MSTVLSLIALWFARRAEGRIKIINDEENFANGRDKRKSAAYYQRRPEGEVNLRPETVEQIENAITIEKQKLDATRRRIERNRRRFEK
jgi:hypothetical protein